MIYFIQDTHTGHVKIGRAKDAQKRLAACQTGTPYHLTLLGTLPGDVQEEALLHDQFEPFHLRGEWFKGEEEFLSMVRLLLFREGKPRTVWDEARKRGGCRSGLRGVTVGVLGWIEPYKVWASRWGEEGTLFLAIYPATEPEPRGRFVDPGNEGRLTFTAADLVEGRYVMDYPMGYQPGIEANRCVLLSEWPVTCCEPTGRIEDRDL